MKKIIFGGYVALLLGFSLIAIPLQMQAQQVVQANLVNHFIAENNVSWTTLGKDENESMPIGNGDISANVWTEKNGDLVVLLSKADAWTETGKLVKLGRARIKLTPNPFADATDFKQTLKLDQGLIEIASGNNILQVWIDANHPVAHVQAHLEKPTTVQANLEFWRKTISAKNNIFKTNYEEVMHGSVAPQTEPDVVFTASKEQITWCHFNPSSYFPYLLKQEHLESLLPTYPDPLFQCCFGAAITAKGMVSNGDSTLVTAKPLQALSINITALTQQNIADVKTWKTNLDVLVKQINGLDDKQALAEHKSWWQSFWNRSWVHVAGKDDAAKVSQGYAIQRYMVASSSRGEIPPKFNGGSFTVGRNLPDTTKEDKIIHNPDYRAWGDSYWNQNNRLLYWPLIATGDTDLLKPWFNMYLKALPLAKGRTQIYYHHDGAHFPETMHFWGLPNLHDFGKDNPTNEIQSHWQKYHVQGSLELIAQMLDVYDYNQNTAFVRDSVVPFADAIVTFYDKHWSRDNNGKIVMSPMQSLETYQMEAVNPTPDIAGLMTVLSRLLALPTNLTTPSQRMAWAKTLESLPPIPIGKTAKGKLPPLGMGDIDGTPTILPAEKYGKAGNSENPELYVAFPYRLYGVGKPGLELAQNTFAARRSPQNTCWGQDGTQGAVLGLTDVAQKATIAEFTNYGDQRFQWFWKPAHDYIPDLDNGGDGMITLQLMLMQCDGKRIQLLPAWPTDWTADFKLHAPFNTTVVGHVEKGKISNLIVTPIERAKDVVVIKQ